MEHIISGGGGSVFGREDGDGGGGGWSGWVGGGCSGCA